MTSGHAGLPKILELKIEAVTDDHLREEMFGRGCEAPSQSDIDLTLRHQVQIKGGNKLVLLLVQGIEPGNGAERTVVLRTKGDLGRDNSL